MKGKKLLLLGGAGVLAWFLFKAAGVANVATKAKFILKGIKFSGLNIIADVTVLNPTGTTLHFTSFAGDVLLGDRVIATAQSFHPITIGANAMQQISITFIPNTFGVLESLTDALNKSVNTKITVSGFANVNGISLPVKMTW